ncbi:hypothetical protein, partial [Microbacterium sp.]|uniref:hypothetical protein n=1 Tax=Microbacterium sp. TaxID=51671 RepID=UPI0039E6952E
LFRRPSSSFRSRSVLFRRPSSRSGRDLCCSGVRPPRSGRDLCCSGVRPRVPVAIHAVPASALPVPVAICAAKTARKRHELRREHAIEADTDTNCDRNPVPNDATQRDIAPRHIGPRRQKRRPPEGNRRFFRLVDQKLIM